MFTKEACDIDLNEVVRSPREIVDTSETTTLKIGKEEYFRRIEGASKVLKSLHNYHDEAL